MRHPLAAALLGLVVGYLVVMGIEVLGHYLFPIPFQPTMENIEEYMHQIPTGSLLMVVLAHLLGAAVAVITVLKLSRKKLPTYIIAVLFFIMTISNLFMINHPVWFAITDVLAVLLGLFLAFKLFKIKEEEPTA